MDFDSKIYIAGHSGFIGKALYSFLKKQGYSCVIGRTSSELDLRNQTAVNSFFEKEKPDYVFLLAAKCGNVAACRKAPAEFLYDNLAIESNVIHAAHMFETAKLFFISTISSYPKECPQPMVEESLLTGPLEPFETPYAIAKLAGMNLCNSYYQEYGDRFITGILPNVYGPGSSFDPSTCHVIPSLLMKFDSAVKEGRDSVEIWGSGKAVRDFLYIDDLLKAMIYMMDYYEEPAPINITAENYYSIQQIAEIIHLITGFQGRVIYDPQKPEGTLERCLRGGKLHDLGWKSEVSFEEGLQRTYQWYLSKAYNK